MTWADGVGHNVRIAVVEGYECSVWLAGCSTDPDDADEMWAWEVLGHHGVAVAYGLDCWSEDEARRECEQAAIDLSGARAG